jgi:hypothetical protein
MGSHPGCSSQQIIRYPLIRNQPFTSKGVPTAYANDPPLTGQADDNLVPSGDRFGRLGVDHRSQLVSYAGERTVSGEANPFCRGPLSWLGPTGLFARD